MRKLDKVDWLLFVGSVPFGGLAGALTGFLGAFAIFRLTGTGNSHNDMFTLFGMIAYGGVAGLIAGPVLVWCRWRRQSRP
jgi:hypothetical protein